MFILMNVIPLLILSLIWGRFNTGSKNILRMIIWIVLVFSFTTFYINGVDWSIYYTRFINDEELYLAFEPGFVIYLKTLLFIANNNFGYAIMLFYALAFALLGYNLKKIKINEPLFIAALLIVFGYTLILEQLRQFIACIIVFAAIINYSLNKSLLRLIVGVIIAATMHVSALIIIPAIFLCKLKSRKLFISVTVASISLFSFLLIFGVKIIILLAQVNFAFRKILFYIEQNPISIQFGWLNLLVLLFVVFYVSYSYQIEKNESLRLLNRFIFVGAVIYLYSGAITFLTRVTFYFIFVAIFIFSLCARENYRRIFEVKSYNTLFLNLYFFVFLTFCFLSYFRNPSAPVSFGNMNYHIATLFDEREIGRIANGVLGDALNGESNNVQK
ncbi:EpsG family protein [Enterobacter asburiae]|uniref:EpsG family protein n=1 Tax=Enterobacter asburiae TaxID=61645 RepID=UPI00192C711B|nr:EpsG family protein [Enterobacter asburiae]MBL5947941.1 EpsG family protein [Enterobacter asburiae]